jgi:LAGLIDADG endonuclease
MREPPHTAVRYSPKHPLRQSQAGGHGDNPQGRLAGCGENPQRPDVRGRPVKLDAGWVTGFVDGEGCFHVGVNPHPDLRAGAQVLPEFTVVQHERDVQLLHALKAFFGCGVVRRNHGDRMAYRVRSKEHLLDRIVPFFVQHPLKSSKRRDFIVFRRILLKMEAGEHLRPAGVEAIRALAKQMNRGRSRESPAPAETQEDNRAKFLVG